MTWRKQASENIVQDAREGTASASDGEKRVISCPDQGKASYGRICDTCAHHRKRHCMRYGIRVLGDSTCEYWRPWFLLDAVEGKGKGGR